MIFPTLNYAAKAYEADTNGKPSSLTFTRATAATAANAVGNIASAASGALRHEYDPVTGEYLGWLIEEARTNELLYSEAVGSATTISNITVTSNAVAAPDGATTADTLTESVDGGGTYHYISHGYTQSAGATTRCYSSYLKAGTHDKVRLTVASNTSSQQYHLDVDLTAATVTSSASGGGTVIASGIDNYGGGWYRAWISGYVDATDTACEARVVLTNPAATVTYQGDGTRTVYVWGRQYETGAFPGPYISTTTASVTRNADVLTVPTSAFLLNATEGTIFVCGDLPHLSTNQYVFSLDDGTTDNSIFAYVNGANLDGVVQVGGAAQLNAAMGAPGTSLFKCALAYKAGDFALCLNGGTVTTDASGSVPSGLTTLRIGHGVSGLQMDGHIRHIAYFPRRLSNTDLQTITG